MPTKLRNLKITRVAVCERGANPDAAILLFKAMDDVSPAVENPVENTGTPSPGIQGWLQQIRKQADFVGLSDSAKLQLFYDLVDAGALRL